MGLRDLAAANRWPSRGEDAAMALQLREGRVVPTEKSIGTPGFKSHRHDVSGDIPTVADGVVEATTARLRKAATPDGEK
jgi:hypothetical protein